MKRPRAWPTGGRSTSSSGPDCLRIASYNLHGCVGRDGERDAERIAGVIAELGCDTVGLQEVYHLELLAERTGLQPVAGPPYVWRGRHVGNALLTRRKVLEVRNHDYTWPRHEPRTALDVDLDVDGESVRVIVTHLGLKPAERRYQVRKLLDLPQGDAALARVVVLGDINEWLPLSRPLRWLNALLGHSPRERDFPVALAALRARPGVGAPPPRPARLRRAPLAARRAGLGPSCRSRRSSPRTSCPNASPWRNPARGARDEPFAVGARPTYRRGAAA